MAFLFLVFSNSHNILLPIKPKPFLYSKDWTLIYDSHRNSKSDQITDAILVSECYFFVQ